MYHLHQEAIVVGTMTEVTTTAMDGKIGTQVGETTRTTAEDRMATTMDTVTVLLTVAAGKE